MPEETKKPKILIVDDEEKNLKDQHDASRSRSPYKPPFDHEKTFIIITGGEGLK